MTLPLPFGLNRALDLTRSAGGAYASRMLGDFGAEVIAVEPLDGARLRQTSPALQRSLGRNKLACAVDLASAAGRELCLRLAAACQIVFVDAGAAVLDYEAVVAVRPNVIFIALTNAEALETGLAAAGAAMAALFHQRVGGEGQRIDVDGRAVAATIATLRVVASSAGVAQAGPDLPPSGTYRCADGSVAIAVRTSEQVGWLAKTVGASDGSGLGDAVARWAQPRSADAAAEALLSAGVAAQPVLGLDQIVDDDHLRSRGFFEPVASPEGGVGVAVGVAYHLRRTPAHTRLPAAAVGQQTVAVLRSLLRMTDAEIEALRASGVIG